MLYSKLPMINFERINIMKEAESKICQLLTKQLGNNFSGQLLMFKE